MKDCVSVTWVSQSGLNVRLCSTGSCTTKLLELCSCVQAVHLDVVVVWTRYWHLSILAGVPGWDNLDKACQSFTGRKPTVFLGVSGILMSMSKIIYVEQIQGCPPRNALALGFAHPLKARHKIKTFSNNSCSLGISYSDSLFFCEQGKLQNSANRKCVCSLYKQK